MVWWSSTTTAKRAARQPLQLARELFPSNLILGIKNTLNNETKEAVTKVISKPIKVNQ